MNSIPAQPLLFNDFSGGLTDNVLLGDAKRYERAANFLIQVDKSLLERDGTIIFDPTGYLLADSTSRIAGLFSFQNESLLLAQSGRSVWTQTLSTGAWAVVTGPSGNEALGAGNLYSQMTVSEYQRQLYFTNDAGPLPGKLYKNTSDVWQVRTAGLPLLTYAPNYTAASLLAKCIALSNALRTSMISHFSDAGVTTGTGPAYTSSSQHSARDKYSLSYFQAETVASTDAETLPSVTPAVAATSESTLYLLCTALGLAYEHHRTDLNDPSPPYHQVPLILPDLAGVTGINRAANSGINAKLSLSGTVTTVEKAAAFLDQLTQRWYWHQLYPYGHSPGNDYGMMSRYLVAETKVGNIFTASDINYTASFLDFVAFANFCKDLLNGHLDGTEFYGKQHGQIDIYSKVTLPTPTDYDSAALVLFWVRWMYAKIHSVDSNTATHTNVFFTTGGPDPDNTVTGVSLTSGGAATTLTVGHWVVTTSDLFTDTAGNKRATRVVASAAGSATFSRPVTTTAANNPGQASSSWFHGSYTPNSPDISAGTLLTTTSYTIPSGELLTTDVDEVGTTMSEWIALGTEWLYCFQAHISNSKSHLLANTLDLELSATSTVNGNPFFIPVPIQVVYSVFYQHEYTVESNGIEYLVQGPPVLSASFETCPSYPVGTVIDSISTDLYTGFTIAQENACATLNSIPTLTNTANTNYDTSVVTVEIYRTTDGGTTSYLVESKANGTTSYSDTLNDSIGRAGANPLNLNEVIYTAGGRVANDPPPESKFIHFLNGFMYYGAITDTGQYFGNRVRQSVQGAPDSAPADFFDDLEDELVGLSSSRNNLIGICKNSAYRFSGAFTSTGQGALVHEKISDAMGGLNSKSIVQTEIGVFYAGTDGFYYTDGYQLIKISIDLNETYARFTKSDTQKARIHGAYDKLTRRVWWSMQSTETQEENDIFYIFYLDYGVKPSGVFTTVNSLYSLSWQPSSHVFFNGRLIIGDSRGYLFKTDPLTKTDPKINTAAAPSTWNTVYIPYDYKSCAIDYGTTFKRKWVTKIHLIGDNEGNMSIQITGINDVNSLTSRGTRDLAPLQYLANPTWGDARVVWDDPDYLCKFDGKMDAWRRFPAGSMRSDVKQVQLTPGNFVIYRSDDYPTGTSMTVTLGTLHAVLTPDAGHTTAYWPVDIADYYISFSSDNYATSYLITSGGGTATLVLTNPNSTLTTATCAWQITGVKKEQRVSIAAFDVHYNYLGDKNSSYPGVSSSGGYGSNA